MSSQQPISFDLLYSIRETQLQHGLRSDDFAKYHAYCTGRIKTLRKQLKLCNAHKIVSSNKKKNNAQNKNQSNQKQQQQQTKKEPKQGSYVAPTQVTENNCKDPRSIILLALVVERCWAESEELRLAKTGPADGKLMQRHQGNANLLMKHSRARLSRAVQMTKRLVEVVDKVGDDELKNETHAYVSSIHGRLAFTSGDFASAKKHFLDARNRYHEIAVVLSKKNAASSSSSGAAGATENKTKSSGDNNGSTVTATNQQKQALAVDLRGECDDRIVTCMRSLGEDASSYKPSMEGSTTSSTSAVGGSGENSAACLSWLGREIPISNFQVQNALRRFDSLDVFKSASNLLDCAAAVEETNGTDGMAWWIYQQQSAFNKMQDSFDRAVGALNDAQDAVTAELTNHTTNAKASDEAMIDQLRLTQHCLKFRTLMCVVARAYLASWSLGSRFLLSTELLVQNGSTKGNNKPSSRLPAKRLINLRSKATTANFSSKEVAFTLQHVVSPIDVVRLFDTVLSSVEESLLLPGVDGEDVVEVLKEVIRSDRLFFVAAGWQVVGAAQNEEALSRCVSALTHVEKVLNGLEKKHPDNSKANKEWIENFGFTCPVLAGFPRSLLVRRAAAARTGSAAMASIPQEASSSNNKLSPSVIEGGAVAKAQQQRKKNEEKASAAASASSSSVAASAPSSSLRHIASDKLQEFATCSAFTEFPPDFQAAPCKPAFVDIASTYAEDYLLGMDDDDETPNNNTTNKPKQSSTTKTSSKNTTNNNNNNNNDDNNQQQQQQQAGSGGWLGWLRGS